VPDDATPEGGGATAAPVAIRCEACRSVVATQHSWDAVTCACGALTVSGRPTKPTVSWVARPGGGWSEHVVDEDGDGDQASGDHEGDRGTADEGAGARDSTTAGSAPRRIGFAP
jgi:hypothetical protein